MSLLVILAAAAFAPPDAADGIEATRQRIAIAAGVRCPPPAPGEIVVCGRAAGRDKFLLPFGVAPDPGSPEIENVYLERRRLESIARWDEPSPVGPGGMIGYTIAAADDWANYSGYRPLLERFTGPDIVYAAKPRP